MQISRVAVVYHIARELALKADNAFAAGNRASCEDFVQQLYNHFDKCPKYLDLGRWIALVVSINRRSATALRCIYYAMQVLIVLGAAWAALNA